MGGAQGDAEMGGDFPERVKYDARVALMARDERTQRIGDQGDFIPGGIEAADRGQARLQSGKGRTEQGAGHGETEGKDVREEGVESRRKPGLASVMQAGERTGPCLSKSNLLATVGFFLLSLYLVDEAGDSEDAGPAAAFPRRRAEEPSLSVSNPLPL